MKLLVKKPLYREPGMTANITPVGSVIDASEFSDEEVQRLIRVEAVEVIPGTEGDSPKEGDADVSGSRGKKGKGA